MRKRVNRLVLLLIIVVGLVSIGCETNTGPINWNHVEKTAVSFTVAEYHDFQSATLSSKIHPEIEEWMSQTPPNGLFKTLGKIPNDLVELDNTHETQVAILNKAVFDSQETVYITISCSDDMYYRVFVLQTGKIFITKALWNSIDQTATYELVLESKDGAVDFQAFLDLVQVRLSR
ncbi:MAG: hypothetical protein IJR83_01290 [Clostridia bacterium]|nr:hypothetical protein [Clostridia bacterium]